MFYVYINIYKHFKDLCKGERSWKRGKTLTATEYATNMITMTTRKEAMSFQARCSAAVITFILGFSLSRCHIWKVASRTKKAIRYWSTESAMAVS